MEKIIPNGTEVLIFKYIREWGANQDDENYIIGTVRSSIASEDLSIHGSSENVQVYELLGEDGNRYIGTYGRGIIGNSFFRTKEEHIKILKRKSSSLKEKIIRLQEKIFEYNRQINLLEKEINTQEDVLAVPCSKAFVVAPEKAEEFRQTKPNPETRNQMEDMSKKFRANNLAEEGEPLVRKRIPTKNNDNK